MIASLLLPPTEADLLHLSDGAIPSARPWSPSRHPCRLVRRDHDGRAPCSGRLVERDRVVGRVGCDPCDVGVERLDQADAGRRVIDSRLGQHMGHDHTRPVDAEMELLPAALAATAVLGRSSFTFAHDREARAIDDEMDRPLGRDAVQPDVQVPTPARQRGMVGRLEGGVHRGEDRPHKALRLAQGQTEDEPECQRGLDRENPRISAARRVDRTAKLATRLERRQKATASHRLAARVLARTPASFRRGIWSCTWGRPLTSWRDRAPRALNKARTLTLAHRREAEEPCTNAPLAK